jgi:PAS domain S-box-containing protein
LAVRLSSTSSGEFRLEVAEECETSADATTTVTKCLALGILGSYTYCTSASPPRELAMTAFNQGSLTPQAQEELFRAVLANSRDVLVSCNFGTSRYEYVSPSVVELVGYSPSEVVGISLGEAIAMLHIDDLTTFMNALRVSEEFGIAEAEYRQKSKDGRWVYVSNRMTVIKDADGLPVRRVSTLRDISEQKRAEERVRESEERFRAVQENSLGRFTILKPFYDESGELVDFTYIYQNSYAARAAGREPEEVVGHRMTEILPSVPLTRFFGLYREVMEAGRAKELEEHYQADGVDEWYRVTATPTADGIAIFIANNYRAQASRRGAAAKQ